MDVYLEIGAKKTIAGALNWPGWSRIGRDERAALQALMDYGTRYAQVLDGTGLDFRAPADVSELHVTERLEGNKTTDFGVPVVAPAEDSRPVDDVELEWFGTVLTACWQAFLGAVEAATGQELRTGPRGGGRSLFKIVDHVLAAEGAYLGKLGWKLEKIKAGDIPEELRLTREASLQALAAAAHGELPERGPRGGVHWTPRYYVRRSAWHILDHAWEIEDRSDLVLA